MRKPQANCGFFHLEIYFISSKSYTAYQKFLNQCMMTKRSLIFSKGITKIPNLQQFLFDCQVVFKTYCFHPKKTEQVIGWGLRPSTRIARKFAQKHNLPFVALEDGFLRSLGLGVQGYPPFAIVYDDIGIYYDTTRPSRLEYLILTTTLTAEQLAQAEEAMSKIKEYRLSKYNQAPDFINQQSQSPIVLVVDQTFGDMAIKYGQAAPHTFTTMLETAISENPNAEIWVKIHPDVLSGKKKGHFASFSSYPKNVHFFTEDVNSISLLQAVEKVYCVTSQMGFEALMLGKTVITFGVPWYAGWGLTDDRHSAIAKLKSEQRRTKRNLLALFYAAYFSYSRYINPNNGERGSIFDVIDYLHRAKTLNDQLRGDLYCVGMSLWKQAVIKPFFKLPSCHLHFVRSQKKLEKRPLAPNSRLLVWGNGKPELLTFAKQHNLPILRMEDGFIRSVGLGSNLVAPISLVIDDLGIYFNAQIPSRLEHILQHQKFSSQDLNVAKKLREHLVTSKIGKYNVGDSCYQRNITAKKVILVPGQVEDDASIQSGSPEIKTNLALLERVRELNPNAYIIYKPHPDVVSGNRKGAVSASCTQALADEVVETANILECIEQADEVHTMTSLAGFEALLRHKKVHCYGLPFYAHWGLTEDHLALEKPERRTRKLTLDELVSAVLVYYPLYIDPQKQHFINAEQAVRFLMAQKMRIHSNGIKRTWIAKQFGKLTHLIRTLTQ